MPTASRFFQPLRFSIVLAEAVAFSSNGFGPLRVFCCFLCFSTTDSAIGSSSPFAFSVKVYDLSFILRLGLIRQRPIYRRLLLFGPWRYIGHHDRGFRSFHCLLPCRPGIYHLRALYRRLWRRRPSSILPRLAEGFPNPLGQGIYAVKGSAKTDATACAARLIVRFAFAKSPLRRDIPKSLFVFKMEDVCSPLKTMKSRLRNRLFRLRLGI